MLILALAILGLLAKITTCFNTDTSKLLMIVLFFVAVYSTFLSTTAGEEFTKSD